MDETADQVMRISAFAATDPAIYYDRLTPVSDVTRPPLVLLHGAGHSGACYLGTPDGREGWAQQFAALGFPVIVPDWPGVGRSGRVDLAELTGDLVCRALGAFIDSLDEPCVLLTHSMSGAYGWKLAETHGRRIRAVIGVAPSAPGNLDSVPEVLDRGDDYVIVRRGVFDRRINLEKPNPFSDELVEKKLIGGAPQFPHDFLDAYKHSLRATPPRLSVERSNIDGSQLRITNTAPFTNKPVLVISAPFDPDHTPDNDGAVVKWFREIGADADYWYLPDQGIDGNGHMMMLEKNNAEIAARIAGWIDEKI